MSNIDTPIQLQGYYKEPYQQIVQPQQIWPVSKYLLRQWLPYLKPAELWLIITARQLSYRNQNCPWFCAYDDTLAQGAGLNTQTFRRLRRQLEKGETPLAQFLQVSQQKRQYIRRNGRLRPAETRYTIRLDDPLAPHHATALANWLKQHASETITGETIHQLLKTAVNTPDLLEAEPQRCAQSLISNPQKLNEVMRPLSNSPALTVSDLIPQLFGQATLKSKPVWGETAVRLHRQITQPDRIHIETQYLRRAWLPHLTPGPALLLVYLRSFTYFNEETGEQRETVQFQTGELETQLGISSSTLRRWLHKIQAATGANNPLGSFLPEINHHKLANQQVTTSYQLAIHTPLIPEDVASYYQHLLHPTQTATIDSPPHLNTHTKLLTEQNPTAVTPKLQENDRKTGVSSNSLTKSHPHGSHLQLNKSIEPTAVPPQRDNPPKVNHDSEKPFYKKNQLVLSNRDTDEETQSLKIVSLISDSRGSRAKSSLQNRGHRQIVHHKAEEVAVKMITTEGRSQAKSSPQNRGQVQNDQGSPSNCSPLKDPKSLIYSILERISLLKTNKQQGRWAMNKRKGNDSFAVVAVKNLSGLLTQLEITGQARKIFQESQLTLEQMVGWYLWASQQPWCEQPVAYTIQRVRHQEPPPQLYEQLAHLPWQQWQQYAILHQVTLPTAIQTDLLRWPLFEAWGDQFALHRIEQLPFGVGQGLRDLIPAIEAELEKMEVEKPAEPSASQQRNGRLPENKPSPTSDESLPHPQDVTLWQYTLQELSAQMTKATFDTHLRGAKLVGMEKGQAGENGRFVVQLRNPYAKEWVDNRLAPTILRTWSAIAGQPVQAQFVC